MNRLNITKGYVTAHGQKGRKGHCIMAQVFDSEGDAMVYFKSTADKLEANSNANLYADAHNTYTDIKMLPSELSFENKELYDCLQGLLDLKYFKDKDGKTPYYLEMKPLFWEKAQQLIDKRNGKT